jgi:ATP-dependent protease HslVU (ClpYQ) ATPase subunit
MMELLLQDLLFDAPEEAPEKVVFNSEKVRGKLEDYVANLERAKLMV